MNEIQYIGEWLLPGQIGHFLTLFSLFAALYATIGFAIANHLEKTDTLAAQSWNRLARIGFRLHVLSVVGIFALLFFLIFNHRFEYKYVWQHSSRSLPVYYMISCFWEGQEGSFLLWQFWTGVLGLIVIRTARQWENSVMSVVGSVQVFLAAMIIGIYILGTKIGISPFMLTRIEMGNAPIFQNPNYLELFLKDGRGLNPLLQNYWMVIHPPTLFLGFASTLIPFAYIIAGLFKANFDNHWIRPTLSWSLFSGGILGCGILMGGAWAYEALSFGGFWAWDPVENASFVPWLTLVAGIHTLLAYKNSGHGLRTTAIFFSLTFWLVLYSTFLTRTGILGDTSVHAFTDEGLNGQLLVFLIFYLLLAVVVVLGRWKTMPSPEKEESAYSREFWLFIGALLLTMLATLVTIDTSWPAINKVFGTNKAITDPVTHYNRYALWFAVVVALLSATIQYLRYKDSESQQLIKKILIPLVSSVVLTLLFGYLLGFSSVALLALLFSALFSIIANANYLLAVLKGKIRVAGASITHIGFSILLLGVLISSAKKEVISVNALNTQFGQEFNEKEQRENVLLPKDKTMNMGEYFVTYIGDSVATPNTYYKILYEKKNKSTDTPSESFVLHPNAQVNPNMGLIANPDTKHYLTRDIFTHVSSVPDKNQSSDNTESLTEVELERGDTAILKNCFVIFKTLTPNPINAQYIPMSNDVAVGATLEIIDINNKTYQAEPIYFIRGNVEQNIPAKVEELGLDIVFPKLLHQKGSGTIKLSITETEKPEDFVILKAIVFPYINLVWLGSIISVIGFLMSMRQRWQEGKRRSATA